MANTSLIIECLKSRGLIEAMTSEEIEKITQKPIKVYIGFDPTADSLHLGNLVGIIVLAHFQRFGHIPVVILGGATGRIGDPSGKSVERPLLDVDTIMKNVLSIRKNFERVLNFDHPTAKPLFLNNDDWLSRYSLVDFLREVGKHFRVGVMLGKESVRSRIESEEGISFTEFSYQLLQAYDFYHLFSHHGVIMQMGGSDQWGNITAGIELIRKLRGESAYGITFPLLVRSDGKKFGKTEEGTIWLSPEKCPPYQFYQYLVRIPDADVIRLMRMLTFMDLKEIQEYEHQMKASNYIPNTAQKKLAEELTRMIHGEEGLEVALRVTQTASPGSKAKLDAEALRSVIQDMPHLSLKTEDVIGEKFVDVSVKTGLLTSKSEAVRLIQNGGAYLNEEKVQDIHLRIEPQHLIGNQFLLIGAGKKKKVLIKVFV